MFFYSIHDNSYININYISLIKINGGGESHVYFKDNTLPPLILSFAETKELIQFIESKQQNKD